MKDLFNTLYFHRNKLFFSLGLCTFIYYSISLFSMFKAAMFSYYDLGLISDYLMNTIYRDKFFWISSRDLSHMGINFTPNSVLILPFYYLFGSQFTLIGCGLLFVFLAFCLQYKIFEIISKKFIYTNSYIKFFIPLGFVTILLFNKFTKSNLGAAHYEFLYIFFASLFIYLFLKNRNLLILLIFSLFTATSREDSGLYVAWLTISFLFLPEEIKADITNFKKKIIFISTVNFLYVAFVILVLKPYFFSNEVQHANMAPAVLRIWGHWGNTYPEMVFNLATSPIKVMKHIYDGAFLTLMKNLLFLPLLPLFQLAGTMIISLPSILLFTASTYYKNQLWHYHSGFILPGLFLYAGIALNRIGFFADNLHAGKLKTFFIILFTAIPIYNLTRIRQVHGYVSHLKPDSGFKIYPSDPRSNIYQELKDKIIDNGEIKSIALSTCDYVFFPGKYILYFYGEKLAGDLIIVPKIRCGGRDNIKILTSIKKVGLYKTVEWHKNYHIFLRTK